MSSYSIWIRVDNDDDADSDPTKAAYRMGPFSTTAKAIDAADFMLSVEALRSGVEWDRMDEEDE